MLRQALDQAVLVEPKNNLANGAGPRVGVDCNEAWGTRAMNEHPSTRSIYCATSNSVKLREF